MSTVEPKIELVPAWRVFSRKSHNARFEDDYYTEKEKAALAYDLSGGFDPNLGTVCCVRMSAQDQGEAVSAIKKELSDLEALMAKDMTAGPLYAATKKLRCDEKGNIRTPDLENNTCYRRFSLLPLALSIATNPSRQKFEEEEEEKSSYQTPAQKLVAERGFMLPVLIKEFKSAKERLRDQIVENLGKSKGAKRYTDTNLLKIARDYTAGGCKESELIRDLYLERGTGQKLHRFLRLDGMVPELNLYERAIQPHPKDDKTGKNVEQPVYHPKGFFPFSRLDKELLKKLIDGKTDVQIKEGLNLKDAVERTIASLMGGEKNVTQMMSKKNVGEYAKDHGVSIGKVYFNAVLSSNTSEIAELNAPAARQFWNDVYAISLDRSLFPKFQEIVKGFLEDLAVEAARIEAAKKKAVEEFEHKEAKRLAAEKKAKAEKQKAKSHR